MQIFIRRLLWPLSRAGLLFAGFLVGCQFDPHYSSYTRTKPSMDSLVGVYVLTGQTMDDQPVEKLRPGAGVAVVPTLVLRQDGSFSAQHIPQWSGQTSDWKLTGFKSGSGTWELVGNETAGYGLGFTSKQIKIPNPDVQGAFLVGEAIPYRILMNFAGDPDHDDVMIFEQQVKVGN